ncbi:hypothetical protein WMF30_47960 [Sorangium sp. So ce134]
MRNRSDQFSKKNLLRGGLSLVSAAETEVEVTLLLRLLGSGRLLREALADLAALPDDAWEKSIAKPLLVHFRLGGQEPAIDEYEVSAEIRAWFEDYEKKLRAEERKEGRVEEAARAVLTALRVRGIAVPDVTRERILASVEAPLTRFQYRSQQ